MWLWRAPVVIDVIASATDQLAADKLVCLSGQARASSSVTRGPALWPQDQAWCVARESDGASKIDSS